MTPNRFPTACVEFKPKLTLKKLSEYPSFYWAYVLQYTLAGVPELKLPPLRGAILAGAPGNGRHTIADGLAGTLKEQGCSYAARIAGITLDTEDVADACAAIDSAVAKLRQHGTLCLLLDCPEDSRHSLAIQEYLRQQMDLYRGNIFPIIITGAAAHITPALQAILTTCQFQSPDLSARQNWLKTYLEGSPPITIDGGVTYITLGKETDGFTWRQLTDLRTLLRRTLVMKYFQNPRIYEAAGPRETLLANGTVHLGKNEVLAAVSCIRSQGMPVTAAPVAGVQYVSAMPVNTVMPAAEPSGTPAAANSSTAASAPAARKPEASAPPPSDKVMTEEEKDAALKAIEFHGNPEKMSFADLINIDDL